MTAQRTLQSNNGLTPTRVAILFAALIGFVVTWALFVIAPPDGFVSPFGMVISLLAGAYLMVLVYGYLS